MPIYDVAIVIALAASVTACGKPVTQAQADAGAEIIPCAVEGGRMAEACRVETYSSAGVKYLIIRHPDGAFRRMVEASDGSGLYLADGAGELGRSLDEDILEVAVDGDRYRFPAVLNVQPDAR